MKLIDGIDDDDSNEGDNRGDDDDGDDNGGDGDDNDDNGGDDDGDYNKSLVAGW